MEEEKLLHWLMTFLVLNIPSAYASDSLEELVDKVTVNIAKSSQFFNDAVTKHEKRAQEEKPYYQDLIQRANEKLNSYATELDNSKSVTTYSKGSIIQQIIANHQLNTEPKTNTGLLIFVSFSMPKEMLWSYMTKAKEYGGRLILRGLVDNSFKETIKAMQLDNDRKLIVDVNPKAFAEYKVNQVPVVVLANNEGYDKFTGSISIEHALEEILNRGDLKDHKLVGGKK